MNANIGKVYQSGKVKGEPIIQGIVMNSNPITAEVAKPR
jgi:hypothetical protein